MDGRKELRQLTEGDKTFIKLHQAGEKRSTAFRKSYPEHPTVIAWDKSYPNTHERQRLSESIAQLAKQKLRSKYIQRALTTYMERMEEFSALSLETATELVQNARSEKVRADLAIEGIRHKVGTPVQKVAVQEQKTVYLTFAKPNEGDIIEGEVAEDSV